MSLTTEKRSTLIDALTGAGASLNIGALTVELKVECRSTAIELVDLYVDYPQEPPSSLCDHEIVITRVPIGRRTFDRRFFTPQLTAAIDGERPFRAFPAQHALPVIESAINWAIATQNLEFLILHSAVVECGDRVVVMPGYSGSGKSTLCAALVGLGWRLLSDEFALVRLTDGQILPHPRPISLKNESIELIAGRNRDSNFSSVFSGTVKGRVAYMKVPGSAVANIDRPARANLIVFPTFEKGTELSLEPLGKAEAFRNLMRHTTNYRALMRRGFDILSEVVACSSHHVLHYGSLDDALSRIEALVPSPRGEA